MPIIVLTTNGVNSTVKLDDSSKPIWEATESTLSILKKEYDRQVAAGTLIIIPDPEIVPPIITPDPEAFLKYCFSGQNAPLFAVFNKLVGLASANTTIQFWYNQLIHGSRPGLFGLTEPPNAGGWGLALTALATATGLEDDEKTTVNAALILYGLPAIL
jgi:hypothetical protein